MNKQCRFTTITVTVAEEVEFILGDVDRDGEVGISDVSTLIDILLNNSPAPGQADCDLDGEIGISDVSALIDYLLNGIWGE